MCMTIASPTNMASGGRLSARSSIDSWIAATCATDSRVAALENPDCRNEMLLAFSCHGRYFCPSCHAKRVAAFADWLAAELLDDTPSPPLRLHHPKTAAATLTLRSSSPGTLVFLRLCRHSRDDASQLFGLVFHQILVYIKVEP